MTLNCAAHNCAYNNSGNCYAGSIKINGTKATSTKNTTCATFTPTDSKKSIANNTSNTFTTSSDINCKACKCTYNINFTCAADSVYINLNNASCETFVIK